MRFWDPETKKNDEREKKQRFPDDPTCIAELLRVTVRFHTLLTLIYIIQYGAEHHLTRTESNVLDELVIIGEGGLKGLEGRFLVMDGFDNDGVELLEEVVDGVAGGCVVEPTLGDPHDECVGRVLEVVVS